MAYHDGPHSLCASTKQNFQLHRIVLARAESLDQRTTERAKGTELDATRHAQQPLHQRVSHR